MSDVALETREPRAPRIAPLALAAVALTLVLMIVRFPYDRLALAATRWFEKETGAQMTLGPVSFALVRWAPGIAAHGAQIAEPNGTRLDLDRLGVRPALAFSWFTGRPSLAIEVASKRGGASGMVTFGDPARFAGTLVDVDLNQLPQEQTGAPVHLNGRADADLDVTLLEAGPKGDVEFEARDGLLTHPNLPMPMQFQKLTGEIGLGGESWAEIRKLELTSPLASGHASGSIGRSPAFASAPLKIELELTVSGAVQSSLRAQGVAIGNDGKIHLSVSGTPARPLVR